MGGIAMFHQQLIGIGAIGTLLNIVPIVDVIVVSTFCTWIHIVRTGFAHFHHTSDKVQGEGFTGVFRLVGIRLNVFNGAGVHLIAVTLLWTMMTLE